MFGELWFYLLGFLLLVSVVLRQGLLFVSALVLLLASAVSWLWGRYCLEGVEYRREFSQRRASFGEELDLTITLTNRKPLPLAWLQAEDEFPAALVPLNGRIARSHKRDRALLVNFFSLRWYEQARRHYRIRCTARGYHSFGPLQLSSGDIFGLRTKTMQIEADDWLLVYPRIVSLAELGLPSKHPLGDLRVRQWIFEDPLRTVGVRDYAYGDSPRRIHWKATARSQSLQAKVYEPTTRQQIAVFLNTNTIGPHWWWRASDSALLESAITVAASLCQWSIDQGHQVGLYVSSTPHLSNQTVAIDPATDPAQLTRVLESLAKVAPFATVALEDLLHRHIQSLAYGATLVVVTAVMSEDLALELSALQSAGHPVALLLVGDQVADPGIRGITVQRVVLEASIEGKVAEPIFAFR